MSSPKVEYMAIFYAVLSPSQLRDQSGGDDGVVGYGSQCWGCERPHPRPR